MSEIDERDGRRERARPAYYAHLYTMMRRVAIDHGYALALHGSMARDLDLVAIPWTVDAVDAETLALTLCAAVDGLIVEGDNPTAKPHGRLAWAIILDAGAYVDLSIMPRLP